MLLSFLLRLINIIIFFAAGNTYENFQFNLDFYKKIPLIGIRNNRFDDLNLILKTIKRKYISH